jgi:hypothetical protein
MGFMGFMEGINPYEPPKTVSLTQSQARASPALKALAFAVAAAIGCGGCVLFFAISLNEYRNGRDPPYPFSLIFVAVFLFGFAGWKFCLAVRLAFFPKTISN